MSARWLARASLLLVLAALLGGRGVTILSAAQVVVDADVPQIPVGIDGETVMMATPVHCAIQPRALRVRVPRDRPGTRPATPKLNWVQLRKLACSAPRRRTPNARADHVDPGPRPDIRPSAACCGAG